MALNKRTIILLIFAILIWVVAIFVLYVNYGSKKPVSPSSSSSSGSQIADSSTQTTTPPTTSVETSTSVPPQLTLKELETIVEAEINVPDVFYPYYVDTESLNVGISRLAETESSSRNQTTPSVSKVSQPQIEDITSDNNHYNGYLEFEEGGTKVTKLYITIDGETKAWYSDELVAGRYKVVKIENKFLLVLDTVDGKIKKIGMMQ